MSWKIAERALLQLLAREKDARRQEELVKRLRALRVARDGERPKVKERVVVQGEEYGVLVMPAGERGRMLAEYLSQREGI